MGSKELHLQNSRSKIAKSALLFHLILLFIAILIPAIKLRPSGDDYCFASLSQVNTPLTIWNWYQSWTGELTGIIFSTILVGLPGGYLSLSLASLLSFASCLLIVGATGSFLLTQTSKENVQSIATRLFFFAIIWFTYLWFPTFPAEVIPGRSLIVFGTTQSITMWQIVGVGYVSTAACGVITLNFLNKTTQKNSKNMSSYLTSMVLGILTGFSSYSTAITLISLACAIAIGSKVLKGHVSGSDFGLSVVFLLSSLISLFLSYASPGASARKTLMPNANIENLVNNFFPSIGQGLTHFSSIALHASSLVLIAMVLFLAFILKIDYTNIRLASFLVLASIINSIIMSAFESITYPAYYHYSAVRVFWCFGLITLTLSLATKFSKSGQWPTRVKSIFISSTAIFLVSYATVVAIANFGSEVSNRYVAWEKGSSYKFLPDIDQQMFSKCWEEQIDLRKSRGLTTSR